MRTLIATALLLLVAHQAAAAGDPAVALAEGRREIAAGRFKQAAAVLSSGLDKIDSLPEVERGQARAALNFYAAVAHSGARDEAAARKHLTEYLRLVPNARRIDAAKYDKRFVALFTELTPAEAERGGTFDDLYPGFGSTTFSTRGAAPGTWGGSAALLILGSKAERRESEAAVDAGARQKLIDEFWRKRDRTPATLENEFRSEFERRAAFADQIFGTSDARGALTDRGKVFVLLGPPEFARRRPLTRNDRVQLVEEAINVVNGTMEHWVYSRDQLPVATRRPTVMFRFVTQTGIGDGVMQLEDPLAKQALSVAAGPVEAKR